MQHLKRRPKSMIKVDCSDVNFGTIELRGDKNIVLNELKYLTKYSTMVMGDVALDAINDGIEEMLAELKEAKHDKDNRSKSENN